MVRALLDGSKTQTRRVIKPQPTGEPRPLSEWSAGLAAACHDHSPDANKLVAHSERLIGKIFPFTTESGSLMSPRCPYGQPGDRLWVRETWRIGAWSEDDGEIAVDYMADNHSRREWLQVPEADDFEKYWLQCSDDCNKAGIQTDEDGKYHWEPGQSPCRIRPSIFMPRWASRITLEIISVHVERLQDIDVTDCCCEGAPIADGLPNQTHAVETWYRELWEKINGDGSWDANPWVWVISFKRIK